MAFETIRHSFRLRRLQKEKRAVRSVFAPLEQKAIQEKDLKALNDLTGEEIHDIVTLDEKIARLQTVFLRDEAQRLGIVVPPFDTSESGLWRETSTEAVGYFLKDEAIVELRSAIRKEKKERREVWQSWAALTIGLIGAMIGLVAALKK